MSAVKCVVLQHQPNEAEKCMTDDICESCRKSTNNCAERQMKKERERKRLRKINFYRPRSRNFPLIHVSNAESVVLEAKILSCSFPLGLRKTPLKRVMMKCLNSSVLSLRMARKKSVNQKINTLNINNNKSSTQPNPINQFSSSRKILLV